MKRLFVFLLATMTTGTLSATVVSKAVTRINSILDRQEDKINLAFNLRYITYNEYENLYYQLEDIEEYKFRALQDRRIDFREKQILNDLIYNLEDHLDQIFYRRTFFGNYYQPIYLRNHYYTNHYHHYRRPRVTFNVNINRKCHHNHRSSLYYNHHNDSRNKKHHKHSNSINNKRNTNHYRKENTNREYRKKVQINNYDQKKTITTKQDKKRKIYNRRS